MTRSKNYEGVPKSADETPKITDAQIQESESEQQRINDAYAIVELNEQRLTKLKAQCFKEIADVAKKYGFTLSASLKPDSIVVDLVSL